MKYILNLLLFLSFFTGYAQINNVLTTPPYYIKTARISDGQFPKSSPIIKLGNTLYFSFDDLQGDEKEYAYKIVRFEENWQETDLAVSEYIDGFDSDIITDTQNATGTLQSYTHYQLKIPNESTKILLSGNYIIQVLDEDDEVIFSLPFIVYEKKINIGVQVKWANDVSKKDQWQTVDFSLYKQSFPILNETQTLTTRIFQNNDISYYKEFHQPTFYKGEEWVYHYPNDAIFEGINEFRQFETKDLRGINYGIQYSELKQLYEFYPYKDYYRDHYLFYKDIDGAYFVKSDQADNPNTESDYIHVHFRFEDILDAGKRLYIIGQFNNFTPSDDYELKQNETGTYECTLTLKQGYYNYMYVTKDKDNQIDIAEVSGSYSQTENDYTVLAYYRAPGARYTRVIGIGKANSDQIK